MLLKRDQLILAGMSANLCVESHLRELLEQGFEVAVVSDATAAAQIPEGDGYRAALTNFRLIANAVWTTDEAEAIRNQDGVWLLADTSAVELTSTWAILNDGSWVEVEAELRPAIGIYPDGRAIACTVEGVSRLLVEYRKRITKPTSEADTLAAIGLDEAWLPIIRLGAGAQLFAGREISRESTEYLSQLLEQQIPGTELGRRSGVSTSFVRIQAVLIKRAVKQLQVQHPIRMIINDPLGSPIL